MRRHSFALLFKSLPAFLRASTLRISVAIAAAALIACGTRDVNPANEEPSDWFAQCDGYVNAMQRCLGDTDAAKRTALALRDSVRPADNATPADLTALRARCVANRTKIEKVCR